jgi:hypothetical protein
VSREAGCRKIALGAAARLPLWLSRYDGQVLISFGLGNEEPSEYLEFKHHNPHHPDPLQTHHRRIGDKFNLSRLSMHEHTITLSNFLTRRVKGWHCGQRLFLH